MAEEIGVAAPVRRGTTLAEVAARVGVSLNTVSRALRAPQTVRPELRRRIAAAIDELDYVPNRLAGGLAGARSALVGVVVSSLYHSEFAAVVEALEAGLGGRGFQVMLATTHYDPARELAALRAVLSFRPAAVALVGVDHAAKAADVLGGCGVPVVEMWDVGGRAVDSAVGLDHVALGRMQAAHLVEGGRRRLAFAGSLREHDARAWKRLRGVAEAAEVRGLPPPAVATRPEPGNPDLGERMLRQLLASDPAVDGIVCNSDAVAFGVLRGLRALGRAVPEEVAVVGFGDAEAAACTVPALTTVRPPREAIGRLSAEVLLARLDGGEARRTVLDGILVVRGSTVPGA